MVKLGIVGCGRIVEDAHAPALVALSDRAEVVALADPSADRRSAVARALGRSAAEFSDWKQMLASVELDAVVIAVPHDLHLEAITDAALAGVDVISEKPLANTLDEVDQIADAIQGGGVRLSVVHNWRYAPDAVVAVEAVKEGLIGDPFIVRNEMLWGVPWASRDPRGNWRMSAAQAGGGVVIDAVYHALYLSEEELGSPIVRVFASLGSQTPASVEDTASILLVHASGATSSIQRSWAAKGGGVSAHEIHGSLGSIRFRPIDPELTNLVMASKPLPVAAGAATPALEIFRAEEGSWRPLDVEAAPRWAGMHAVYETTLAAWAADADAPVGLDSARRVLEIVAAIYESASEGRAIDIAHPSTLAAASTRAS